MTIEPRAATIEAVGKTGCLVFTRAVYEEVISSNNSLISKDVSDHECPHVSSILPSSGLKFFFI